MKTILVWDLPVRLFHWALVILVCVSFYTGLTGGLTVMDYHMLSGYSILALVLFRIAWGFIGGRYARFSSFVSGPRTLVQAARAVTAETAQPVVGHNPLGGLSVLAMLLVLLIQAATGLFSSDDIFIEGPLMHLVSDRTGEWLTGIHRTNAWILCSLVVLHLCAVTFYEVYKRQRLILPMLTGRKTLDTDDAGESRHRLIAAIVMLALTGTIVWLLVNKV